MCAWDIFHFHCFCSMERHKNTHQCIEGEAMVNITGGLQTLHQHCDEQRDYYWF